ncbi:SbcC/MukB-like Walker B domain-containing protein, partial [Phocaeicola dorei]|uniref:SbcC/MukB-like Walker B domain-containing protein n=2 Tax=Bacteroidaceae TaxID=815 RepID=UPI0032EEE1E7
ALTGEVFRSRWTVRRSRGKVDGSLQKVEMTLTNLTSGVEQQGTKTELLSHISKLIGLSFEQFNRSVLLAQGDFATFLKARQTDKAEILEKLTGTEIYSRISASIYERTKRAEGEYKLLQERIKGIELLTEEQLQQLSAEKEELQVRLSVSKKKEETLSGKLKWLEEEGRLNTGCIQAEETLSVVRKEIEAARPRYELLFRIEQAQDIRDVYMEQRNARQQTTAGRSRLNEIQVAIQKNAALQTSATAQWEAAQKAQTEFKAYLLQQEPQLDKARALDVQLAENRKQLVESRKEVALALQAKDNLHQSICRTEKEISLLAEKQNILQTWFERYTAYSQLIPAVELITSLLSNLEIAKTQTLSNQQLLEKVRNANEMEEQRLKSVQQEAERLNRLLPAEVLLLRAQLEEGKPCPVCGSLHHPMREQINVQSLQEEELNHAKEQVAKEMEQLKNTLNARQLEMARLSTLIENYTVQSEDILEKVETCVSIIPTWKDLLEQGTLKRYVQQFGRQWNTRLQEQTEIKEALTSKSAQRDSLKNEEANAIRLYEEKKQKEEKQQTELEERTCLRASLLNGELTEKVVANNVKRQKELEQQQEKAMNLHHSLTVQAESYKGQIAQLEKELVRLTAVLQQDELKINEWLTLQKETYAELEQLLSKDKNWILAEKQALSALKEKETVFQAVLSERRQKKEEHQQAPLKPDTTESRELLTETLTACTAAKEAETGRLAQIEVTIQNHIKGIERIAGIKKELEEKTSIYENWAKLNELFGSQTGTKFKEIAQGYTLDVLLLYANRHLQDLAPRYELQRIPDTLALQIVDLDMMGEVRSVHSLSGGESFLVSLALALGLSSLSSNRMNVESLFIDEGFGSLDMDTLRIAMDALERLQMQGRKIGVISHVAEMTERIPAQVQVVKTGSGRSKVQVMGQI